ncbi:restriction endonuclease subunit S, partial [Paraprevotella clara]|uniref:restriction endonuclease subunit S n=1 Tax=Paraprevotella clara TaxID=454154 RepID=UPI003F7F1379
MDTKALRQKILDLAIRGKLVPQDPNDEPASVLLERIKAEKERLIKEGKIKRSKKAAKTSDTPHYGNVPFEVPSGWVWCELKELCNKFSTGPFGSMVHKSDYIDNSDYPLINPANIIDGKIDVTKAVRISADKAKELERYILEEYDILLARRGDLSKCAIVINEAIGAYCGTGSFFLHLNGMDARFFSVVYGSTYLQKILKSECVGATMDNLNQGVLENILMPYPPLSEQQRIVAEIEKWFTLIDTLEADSTNLQNLIASTKSKVLDLAIHGKLVPQDPNDEPAIELLKCINPKAEITCDNGH